jgi:UDP-3-O-[3-hydroxymyristoyl] glucosamine N-acyltransferase
LSDQNFEPRGITTSPCSFRLAELAEAIGGNYEGDPELGLTGIAGLREAETGDLSFLANGRYQGLVAETQASAIIVNRKAEIDGIPLIRVDDPYLCYLKAIRLFSSPIRGEFPPGISERAFVHADAELGADCHVGDFVHVAAGCRIGRDVVLMPGSILLTGTTVGDASIIFPNVTLREGCKLGERVIVHAGSVIGSDGFGYAWDGERHRKIPQIGHVALGDDVEIGANVTIDRATTGVTRIADGCKIDNLVQIAHNVEIARNSIVVAQVGISGSTRLGENVKVAGQAGIVGHIEIGDGAQVGAQAGVTKSVEPGRAVSGYPARPHDQSLRLQAAVGRLPELVRRVKEMEHEIADLRRALEDGDPGGKEPGA